MHHIAKSATRIGLLASLLSLLIYGLLPVTGCGGASGPTVIVSLSGTPDSSAQLRVSATLNNVLVREPELIGKTASQLVYPLAAGSSGSFVVEVRGLDGNGCSLASGLGTALVPASGGERIELAISLQSLSPPQCTLQIRTSGSGTVTSNPAGLSCGTECELEVPAGSSVTLLATPAIRNYFGGWSGACVGAGPCTVTIGRATTVEATFFPQLCTQSNVCWESPLPADINLTGVWGAGPNDLWAVGDGGQLLHYDGSAWFLQNSPTQNNLRAIWGSSPTDVWAVGLLGTILHYDGSTWSASAAPGGLQAALSAVSGTGPGDVWAVGAGGAILHYDGGSWSQVASGLTADLAGVYAGRSSVFVISASGQLYQRSGTSFSLVGTNPANLNGISGAGDASVFLVGDVGTLQLYDGAMLSKQIGTTSNVSLRAVHARSPSSVFAVGSEGAFLRWNGASLARLAAPANQLLQAVFAVDDNNVWAVGARGTILHYDGSSVAAYGSSAFPDTGDLRSVSGTSATDLWAVGSNNLVLHNTGQGFVPVSTGQPSTVSYRGVFSLSPTEAWIVGNNNVGGGAVVLRWNGQTLTSVATPGFITQTLTSVSGSGPTNIWIGGANNTILRWNGSTLTSVPGPSPSVVQIQAVAALSPSEVYFGCSAVTDPLAPPTVIGCLLRWNGSVVTLLRGLPAMNLTAASIAASNDVWFSGYSNSAPLRGMVLRVQSGTPGTPIDLGVKVPDLYGIGARSGSDIWLVGAGGTILHSTDALTFSPVASGVPTGTVLYGIAPVGSAGTILVGSQRTILRVLP